MSRIVMFASVALVMLSASTAAHATVNLAIVAGPGVDLNNIHVGDTFELDVLMEGSSGEHFVSGGGGNVSNSSNLSLVSAVIGRRVGNDFSTDPDLFDLTIKATAAGAAFFGTVGSGITSNEATYIGLSSGPLNFTVLAAAVPEPATWAMMLAGMGAIGFAMRRRANVSVSYA